MSDNRQKERIWEAMIRITKKTGRRRDNLERTIAMILEIKGINWREATIPSRNIDL